MSHIARHIPTKYGNILMMRWSLSGTDLMESLLGDSLSAAWSTLSLMSSIFSESQRLRMFKIKALI